MKIAQFFKRKDRTVDGGQEWFYTLTDDRPDWLYEAVYEAHGEEGPNDWVYDTLDSIARMIDDCDDPSSVDSHEIADSLTSIWNAERSAWLAGHLSRAFWVDEAREQGFCSGDSDLFEQLGMGQYLQIQQMADIILQAIEENEEEPDEEE